MEKKILNKIKSNNIWKGNTSWQVEIFPGMQGCLNIWKLINAIHYVNRKMNINNMIISKDAEKAFDKIK